MGLLSSKKSSFSGQTITSTNGQLSIIMNPRYKAKVINATETLPSMQAHQEMFCDLLFFLYLYASQQPNH